MSNTEKKTPTILTNMAFWQSDTWVNASTSIYDLDNRAEQEKDYPALKTAWILFARRKEADVIVTMGAKESLLYGLLCSFFFTKSRQIMTEVFIDDVKSPGLFWTLKTALYRHVARRSLGILTNSTLEIETMSRRYRMDKNKLIYIPLNTTVAEPRKIPLDEGYIFSAGRSLRDYRTLIEAVKDLSSPVHIVCGLDDLTDIEIPDHVHLHREVTRKEYLHLLERATLVVLPLLPTERSTGQLVMLEAMAFGKPVITSTAPGTVDYMEDGKTGRLVPPGDVNAIKAAIQDWIDNPEKARRCGNAGLASVKANFTIQRHTQNRLDAIRELYAKP